MGSGRGNRVALDALDGPATDVHCRQVRSQDFRVPNRKVHREQSQARQTLPRPRYPDRSAAGRNREDIGRAQYPVGRCLRTLSENQEFPLASQRPAFPRLSPDARRAVGRDFRDHRPAGGAGSQARRRHVALDRADREIADHPGQQRGLRAAARDAARADGRQQAHGGGDAEGPQACRSSTRIPAPPACSRLSSTRPSGAPGSCSRPAARKAATRRRAFSPSPLWRRWP